MVICSSSSSNSNPPLKSPEARFQTSLSLKKMGCITSKVMSKSISFKEELNITLQRRSNSISSIQELIISSNNNTDQFLNLLCTSNTETPTSNPNSNPNPNPKPDIIDDLARRSKSCHWFPEHELSPDHISDEIIEQGWSASKIPRRRARSIHTVEEYDAILENLWLSRDSDKKSTTGEESSKSTEETIEFQEKGLKRKAVAERLESLTLPQTTIEFQKVDSLKDWLQVGVGAYVTPRFGSYAVPCDASEGKGSESVGFNPELVAAFEECMLQLQEEEDIVLKHIAGDLEEGEGEESVPSLSKDIEVQI